MIKTISSLILMKLLISIFFNFKLVDFLEKVSLLGALYNALWSFMHIPACVECNAQESHVNNNLSLRSALQSFNEVLAITRYCGFKNVL